MYILWLWNEHIENIVILQASKMATTPLEENTVNEIAEQIKKVVVDRIRTSPYSLTEHADKGQYSKGEKEIC